MNDEKRDPTGEAARREHRRGVRLDLACEDPEETAADFLRRAYQMGNVRRRRDGDKLNHFMRWCEAITAGMTTEEASAMCAASSPTR